MQSRKPQAPIITLAFLLIANITANAQAPKTYMTVPAGNEYTHLDTAGVSVLPSGRLLTPAGRTIRIAHDPFGMAVSPDGSKTVTLHNGVFTVIDNATLKNTRTSGRAPAAKSSMPMPPSKSSIGISIGVRSKAASGWTTKPTSAS